MQLRRVVYKKQVVRCDVGVENGERMAGRSQDGDVIEAIKLRNAEGMCAIVLTLGARLQEVRLREDKASLVQYLATLEEIEADAGYVNVPVGRVCNRIRDAKYGDVELDANSGGHHIHGGRRSWDKRLWQVEQRLDDTVKLCLLSPHNDQGYPSSVAVSVTYKLQVGGKLCVDLQTTNLGDIETITNMTFHPYIDLSGSEGASLNSARDWTIQAASCDTILELDEDSLPTGELSSVDGTPFDLRSPRPLTHTYDNYFICRQDDASPLRPMVSVIASNMQLRVSSNQPGFQLYTPEGFASVAIEPSGYIDAPTHAHFVPITLAPRATRTQSMVYQFVEL